MDPGRLATAGMSEQISPTEWIRAQGWLAEPSCASARFRAGSQSNMQAVVIIQVALPSTGESSLSAGINQTQAGLIEFTFARHYDSAADSICGLRGDTPKI